MAEFTDKAAARKELHNLRAATESMARAASAAGDEDEVARLKVEIKKIDALTRELALKSLAGLAGKLTELQARIRQHQKAAEKAAGSVGGTLGVGGKKKPEAEQAAKPAKPAPAEAAEAPGRGAEPVIEMGASPTAPDPGFANDGRLILTEAHLIALWKRSQFPIDTRGVIVFGLRGCRPIVGSGTGFEPEHEFEMMQVNYQTMNCVIGQWRPGAGFAIFPGSTVPRLETVKSRVQHGGTEVNQMGRGRYLRYAVGLHKAGKPSEHWALRLDSSISLQRTSDNAEFDELDRWEVSNPFDNIHCAFGMGESNRIPDARFSSAGCQVVAGSVKGMVPGSESGPWRRFIQPFAKGSGQTSAEYVLFGADEAQQVIRTHYRNKNVVLRFGSGGPWVKVLQTALVERSDPVLNDDGKFIDGEFGPGTFRAVIDFQQKEFGPRVDDGIVGPETAEKLGFELPTFDFEDAIAGGSGCALPDGGFAEPAPSPRVEVAPRAVAPGDAISWGGFVTKRHGVAFKQKVVEIARRLSCDPNHLMAVMAFETGGTFLPDKKNAAGSGAIGLIQFIPPTAVGLGTTTAKLAVMSAFDQLDFVEKHFRSIVGSRPLPTLEDVYMVVLLPVAVGKPDSFPLFKAPSKAYSQNAGLDINKDGLITKAEAAKKVHDMLLRGMAAERIG